MDGLSLFIDNTWEKIRTQKELNLPDQRVMVANLRCNELKDEALEKVKDSINSLTEQCADKLFPDFSQRCKDLIKQAVSHYEEFAHQYDQKVFKKIRDELGGSIFN